MSEDRNDKTVPFDFPKDNLADTQKIIKVIGVGGGGGNAVSHMFREGIHDVTFLICNTDSQALKKSPVPNKLQLGTEGLGAGNNPAKGKAEAEESKEAIRQKLDDGSRMVFITAGMGGGTGTGAAPIIARIAKEEMGILTVGIVTIPFLFEGNQKINQALDGVEELSKHVDALLVINNERLREVYSDLSVPNAFAKADDILSVAAKSIAEIITVEGVINLDFNDVNSVTKDGGVAIMSTGYGEGEGRVMQAINDALHSPLLNNNDIFNSKRILFNISYSPACELMMDEMNDVHNFMSRFDDVKTKWGLYLDDTLGNKVKFTILATGFGIHDIMTESMLDQKAIEELKKKKEEEQRLQERKIKYYGGMGIRSKPNVFFFTQEDLDNDNVISMVEDTPTYKRSGSELKNIQTKATLEKQTSHSATESESTDNTTITF